MKGRDPTQNYSPNITVQAGIICWGMGGKFRRLDSNIESKSLNNTYLNIIEIFKKLFKKINIIESQNLVVTSTSKK